MAGAKWSDDTKFTEGGECQIGDKIMGLRSGANYKFDFPSDGIKDGNGNYIIKWATTGAAADNFLQFTNGEAGIPLKIESSGADTNVSIDIDLKGTGILDVNGLFTINGAVNINDIIDDDTMASATDQNLATAESIVAYIAATAGGAGGSDTQLQYNNSGTLDGISTLTYNGINVTSTRGLTVDGSSDEIQLKVQAHSTQTTNILEIENSAATDLLTFDNSGVGTVTGQWNVDNLRLDGNTISSTDTAGNINITPDTTGDLVLDGLNWPQADGTANQGLITNGAGQLSFADVSIVTTPTVDQTIARFDGTGGALEDSGVTISDTDVVSGITQLNVDNLRLDGNTISSTDAAGNVNITPDTTGSVLLHGVTITSADAVSGVTDLTVDNLNINGNTISSTSGDIALSSTGDIDASTNTIKNVVDPTSDQDAATKKYVDDQTADLRIVQPTRVATTSDFASTYDNGTSGVGATLTASSNGAISIDGVSLALNDRVLVKDQTTTLENGVYFVSTVGDGSNPAVLTRSTDFDEPDEIVPGDLVNVLEGTANEHTGWLQTADVSTIGTDAILFVQFTADFSNVVTLDGTQTITGDKTFSVGTTIDGTADEIQLKVQGNGTQTTNIFEVENSAGSNLFSLDNSGVATTAADAVINGVAFGKGLNDPFTNTVCGLGALSSNTTGERNTATGFRVLLNCTSGDRNTGNGHRSLNNLDTGIKNTATGDDSLFFITTGTHNTGVGVNTGSVVPAGSVGLASGSDNTLIGAEASVNSASANDCIAIGSGVLANAATGSTSSHDGASIAIGSSDHPVGFRGDDSIYPSTHGEDGYWRIKVNGTFQKIPLRPDSDTEEAYRLRSVEAGITASATQTQGQQPLTREVNEVATVSTTNDVVTLDSALAGKSQLVINNGANTLQIFPASGDNLGAGVDTSTTLAAGSNQKFVAYNATNWVQL